MIPIAQTVILIEMKDLGVLCCAKILRRSASQDDSAQSLFILYEQVFIVAFAFSNGI